MSQLSHIASIGGISNTGASFMPNGVNLVSALSPYSTPAFSIKTSSTPGRDDESVYSPSEPDLEIDIPDSVTSTVTIDINLADGSMMRIHVPPTFNAKDPHFPVTHEDTASPTPSIDGSIQSQSPPLSRTPTNRTSLSLLSNATDLDHRSIHSSTPVSVISTSKPIVISANDYPESEIASLEFGSDKSVKSFETTDNVSERSSSPSQLVAPQNSQVNAESSFSLSSDCPTHARPQATSCIGSRSIADATSAFKSSVSQAYNFVKNRAVSWIPYSHFNHSWAPSSHFNAKLYRGVTPYTFEDLSVNGDLSIYDHSTNFPSAGRITTGSQTHTHFIKRKPIPKPLDEKLYDTKNRPPICHPSWAFESTNATTD